MGHTFQSFWWGDALTPYERVCLQSFVDRGHAFDLYTYDPDIVVPRGVRVRDAGEIVAPEAFFVYPEGPGKGSPAAFANLFRYKLLHDRGGWWVDTDVVCLADDIPAFEQFFARQDARYVNVAILFARPGDRVMARCFERAIDLGSDIQWGDTGPHLLTDVLAEDDALARAHPASVCYPLHFSDALDVVRPSRRPSLPAGDSPLFWHLWNAMLVRGGIRKHCLPPRGSLLRELVDRHPVDGWTGEYDEALLEDAIASRAALARLEERSRVLDVELQRVRAELTADRATLVAQQATLTEREAEVAARDVELTRATAALAACNVTAERRAAELECQSAEAARARADLAEILDSTSWRVTAPFRAVGRRSPRLRAVVRTVRSPGGGR